MTKRARLEQVERATGETPKGLVSPDIPEEVGEILDEYWGIKGAGPLSYAELLAYSELMQRALSPRDVIRFRAIDDLVEGEIARLRKQPGESTDGQSGNGPDT